MHKVVTIFFDTENLTAKCLFLDERCPGEFGPLTDLPRDKLKYQKSFPERKNWQQ